MIQDKVTRDEYILVYGKDLIYFFDLPLYIGIYTSEILYDEFKDLLNFDMIEFSTYENCIYRYFMRDKEDFFEFVSGGKVTRDDIYKNIDYIIDRIDFEVFKEGIIFTDVFKGLLMSLNMKSVKSVDIFIDNEIEATVIFDILKDIRNEKLKVITKIPETYERYTCIYYNTISKLENDNKNKKLLPQLGIAISATGFNTEYSNETKKRHLKNLKLKHDLALISLFSENRIPNLDIYG